MAFTMKGQRPSSSMLRAMVEKLNIKLEDFSRIRISLEKDATGYKFYSEASGESQRMTATEAAFYLSGMYAMYFILSRR